jgi:hypothetical protein
MKVVALILAAVATALTLGNAITLARSLFSSRHGSLVPLLGGVSGALALRTCPLEGAWHWAWLPLLLDPGCSWTALLVARAALSTKPKPPGNH